MTVVMMSSFQSGKRKNTSFKITSIAKSRPPSHDDSGDDSCDDTEDISDNVDNAANGVNKGNSRQQQQVGSST